MDKLEADYTANEECDSFNRVKSLRRLIFGSRAMQFDAFLQQVPTSDELTTIAKKLNKPEIRHVVLGRLVPPYLAMTDEIVKKLRSYSKQGRNLLAYTNSTHSNRLESLKGIGISLETTCIDKPSLRGFEYICNRQKIDPAHAAMIGSYPITDMPLTEEGEAPFFPLNILVASRPSQRKLIGSWRNYFRTRFFYAINLAAVGIVRLKNPNMLRE